SLLDQILCLGTNLFAAAASASASRARSCSPFPLFFMKHLRLQIIKGQTSCHSRKFYRKYKGKIPTIFARAGTAVRETRKTAKAKIKRRLSLLWRATTLRIRRRAFRSCDKVLRDSAP